MKNRKVAGDGFIGTVIAVGRAVPATSFKAGNAVFGIADGEWVNSSGNIPKCMSLRPDDLRHISAETAKELGIMVPGIGGGCIII
ncbi:hypothetical protein FRB96_003227 [Tulasnella sp. 330]|nr:hypothetical protein FRB96_003227 [Tulasnella sp. 330]KAG8874918.1 hypothetical protein FRB97_005550 [Tulasnella sp. 331]